MTEARQNRIPIMFSHDEMKAIDNYRFDNRINTRAEAIRHLIKKGLEAEAKEPKE